MRVSYPISCVYPIVYRAKVNVAGTDVTIKSIPEDEHYFVVNLIGLLVYQINPLSGMGREEY